MNLGKVMEVEDEKIPSSSSQLHNLSIDFCLMLGYDWFQQCLVHKSRSLRFRPPEIYEEDHFHFSVQR